MTHHRASGGTWRVQKLQEWRNRGPGRGALGRRPQATTAKKRVQGCSGDDCQKNLFRARDCQIVFFYTFPFLWCPFLLMRSRAASARSAASEASVAPTIESIRPYSLASIALIQ